MTKLILYIATSIDGFIADSKGQVDWLPQPESDSDLEIFGYYELMNRIDTLVMGSRSFKQIFAFGGWTWTDKHSYVMTSQSIDSPLPCISIINDSPSQFMQRMKNRESGKDIWLLGGAELAKSFEREHLIDEIVVTVVPQKLGHGILLDLPFDHFYQKEEKSLSREMFQRVYLRKD